MIVIALGPGSTGYTATGLAPGTYYGAWLRQRCHWELQETDAQQARLALYNAHGTELYAVDLRSPRTTIGIADLPAGVYFVVLTTPDGTATRRLVNEP